MIHPTIIENCHYLHHDYLQNCRYLHLLFSLLVGVFTFRSFYIRTFVLVSFISKKSLAKLPKSPNRYTIKFVSNYYKKLSLSENSKLDSTTEGYLFIILKNVNEVTKAAGIDQISGKFLKDGARILAKPISELCNLSMTLGSFPDAFKIAKVKPLFKKGSKTDPSNYRPISLLP